MTKNTNVDVSYYIQLYENLKSEIIKKNAPNSKFNSIRQVGIKYNTNINTVLKVF